MPPLRVADTLQAHKVAPSTTTNIAISFRKPQMAASSSGIRCFYETRCFGCLSMERCLRASGRHCKTQVSSPQASAISGLSADMSASSDLYTQSFQSGLDPASGFAFVSTAETCVVWNFAKVRIQRFRLNPLAQSFLLQRSASPTCYVFYDDDALLFPLTDPVAAGVSLAPLAVFVPPAFASATEPGLILAAPETGMIRYWENVSLALMPGFIEKASERRLDLSSEERVTGLHKIQVSIVFLPVHTRLELTAPGRMECLPLPPPRVESSASAFLLPRDGHNSKLNPFCGHRGQCSRSVGRLRSSSALPPREPTRALAPLHQRRMRRSLSRPAVKFSDGQSIEQGKDS